MKINGKKVVDATKSIEIKISKADTIKGASKDPGACAAARAAKRLPNCISARVHLGRVYIEHKDKWVRYKTGDALRSEVIVFDRGGSFEPGTYQINPPAPSDREDYRRSKAVKKKNRELIDPNRPNKVKKARKLHVVHGVRSHGANR